MKVIGMLQNRRVITGSLCGLAISTSFFLFGVRAAIDHGVSTLTWPIFFVLLSLYSVPYFLVTAFIADVLGGPELLAVIGAFFYWPLMGAFIASRKHYLIWSLGIGLVHCALGGTIIYVMVNMFQ